MAKKKKSNSLLECNALEPDVDSIINLLTQEFGDGAAFRSDTDLETFDKGVISTGILSLDRALGVGGMPIGRIIEVFGTEMSGKSSLAFKIAGEAQRKGIVVVYIDLEHSLDLELARNSGMRTSSHCVISHPVYGEEAMKTIEMIIREGHKVFVVVDSVAALLPKVEMETAFDQPTQLGRQAALMTEALRKLAGLISKSDCTVLFVNQTRQKIGGYFPGAKNTPGGNALKFYSSVRLQVSNIGKLTQGEEVVGHTAKIKVEKNKLAAPFKEAKVDLFYGSGFCGIADVLKIAVAQKIVNQAGSWYSFGSEKLGQGLFSTLKNLIEVPALYFDIRDKVVEALGITLAHDQLYYDKTIKIGDVLYQKSGATTAESGGIIPETTEDEKGGISCD